MARVISYSIIIINTILRNKLVAQIQLVGFHTNSQLSKFIKNYVFMVQFINTAIITLLLNANLEDFGLGWLFDGKHADFTSAWYASVGNTLVGAMIFNFELPIIMYFLYLSRRVYRRMVDRGFSNYFKGTLSTKKKTIQGYIDTYSGPPFPIHFKYSLMMNISFVTFMYGSGMPILFCISAATFAIFFVMEKLLVAYSFQEPPAFDANISISTIEVLMWAPLLYLAFGFWMTSNTAIFGNHYRTMQTLFKYKDADQSFWTMSTINSSYPLFYGFFVLLLILLLKPIWREKLNKIYPTGEAAFEGEGEVLDPYFDSLALFSKQWWFMEELLCRDQLGLNILSDQAYEKFDKEFHIDPKNRLREPM